MTREESEKWQAKLPILSELLRGADHVDVKTQPSEPGLRQFVAAMMAYEPGWVRLLFLLRKYFVRLIGLRQDGQPVAPRWSASQVPMEPGAKASFFTVRLAIEEQAWAVEARERHLKAALCVVRGGDGYRVVTIVHYLHWTGPLYFNVIRPLHHCVIAGMARAGARGAALASNG